MKGKFNKLGNIIIILLVILIISVLFAFSKKEGFSGLYDLSMAGSYPKMVDEAILDDYPKIGKNQTSKDDYSEIWWHFPIFSVGSYEQITNNLRYRYNPDNGTCVRADFCGAVYHDKKNTKTNIVKPLPPAEEGPGARVGYYRSEPNELYFSIPTNENILY